MRGSRGAATLDSGQAVLTGRLKSILSALAAAILAAACSHAPGAGPGGDTSPGASDIKALRWLAKDADKVAFLTTLPAGCEAAPSSDSETTRRRLLGKIAFESPALLGGAAARMGLSCSSCHLNGRGNPHFFLEGVSDKPGTADVTSSLLSKVRGDGNFNPVAIPDIAARDGKQIRDRTGDAFRAKVRGLVVEEFDGQQPPPFVFDTLVAYLDSLDPANCSAESALVQLGSQRDLDLARYAYDEAVLRPDLDPETRIFYLRAARFGLERVFERSAGGELGAFRDELGDASRKIGERIEALRVAPAGVRPDLREPLVDWMSLGMAMARSWDRSLYNPEVLRAVLAAE
jgi:hypothetical protein